MAYFAAFLAMQNPERNQELRPQHLQYLKDREEEGKLFGCGPFADGSGGLVIYKADSYEEAKEIAEKDPYVTEGVRRLELREWKFTQTVQL
ncbi:YciI family protein [Paenibacillus aurantius]|uniref:YciI family protein n=1 Tax=Paenibacillus aurantius TaxID=2918900 RepID=A0AA96RHQ7_9BACL|nr:YciI family protein [Paenibacillus aurantius]WNQ13811.1 YciI family protein [Paenibacillus aurantius]